LRQSVITELVNKCGKTFEEAENMVNDADMFKFIMQNPKGLELSIDEWVDIVLCQKMIFSCVKWY